jgi:nucleotide-binding universal stress UspA family protein
VADEGVDVALRAAGDHDILLVGSRGYGPTKRVMLGSTSGYLG